MSDTSKKPITIDEKRKKIISNYDTIAVLRERAQKQASSGMKRSTYITMIMEVTKKVDKQNLDLTKVIHEIRGLQKDISRLRGQLDRRFAAVESLILNESKTDTWSRECLGLLYQMHDNCQNLVDAVEDIGDVTRELNQLEDQIGRMSVSSK